MFSIQRLLQCIQTGPQHFNINLLVGITILIPWTLLYYVRLKAGDRKTKTDLLLPLVVGVGFYFRYSRDDLDCTRLHHAALYGGLLLYLLCLYILPMKEHQDDEGKGISSSKQDLATPNEKQEKRYPSFMKPLLFPCRTAHTRFFPKKHSFSYSYFFVGIPVDFEGNINGVLSAGKKKNKQGWFHVDPDDYLQRSNSNDCTLRQKLDTYLNTQDFDPSNYAYAYFITGPRFLGYSFNPVSFWYLYNNNLELTAMILEVNNTFDERRMYLLKAPAETATNTTSSTATANGKIDKTQKQFRNIWAKDFHVSPFNDREGGYSLTANDVWAYNKPGRVSNSIDLRTPEQELKLNARVFSTGPEIDPSTLNFQGKAALLVRWGGIGFLTFPRILREAWTLYMKRGLQVWFRPEVTRKSIGRQPTKEEIILEYYIRRYLAHLVANCKFPLKLSYQAPRGMTSQDEQTFTSKPYQTQLSDNENANDKDKRTQPPETCRHLEIHIISPAFYSRFIHYAHTRETFDREYLCTHDKNKTVYVSAPGVLHEVLEGAANGQASSPNSPATGLSSIPDFRWRLVQTLRSNPAEQSYLEEGNSGPTENEKKGTTTTKSQSKGVSVSGAGGNESGTGGKSHPHSSRSSSATSSTPTTNQDGETATRSRQHYNYHSHQRQQEQQQQQKPRIVTTKDIRALPLSPLDMYVCSQVRSSATYRRTVTKLFLADRFCFGLPGVLDFVDLALRLLLTALGIWAFVNATTNSTIVMMNTNTALLLHHHENCGLNSNHNNNNNAAGSVGNSRSNTGISSKQGGHQVDTITNARGFVNHLSARAGAAEQATELLLALLLVLRGLLLTNAAHAWSLLIKGARKA